ncbi:aminotransferase class I and II [Desulfonatronospira thiodismutans ASO3-1]|uniref:Aminotransferase n=1 Tax=Desulfonatronospira thiodismutans ASO3-1 TaxID=555779 RepID=D6STW6_9BACT|nr:MULTISPECIES: aminotransferase class I/II-fold pyridoxal phosphate-dependent enzyme [Desulfonatronospira]EFI34132.1 aminotransferase class I and II [Desulfonatronospira thiodismutans ASO3-1]RQD75173.1 MAG: aminotransferase class I/II-fold pyridoxal phosphate-dependent enzyme [Desulfonatronospira sp. MSAO_Bac3]
MAEFARINRLPPYVFAIVNDLKMQLRRQGEDIVDLGMGNPDLATPQHIVDKLVEAASKGVNHRYSASKGIPNLRKAICDWYKRRYDVDLDPETEAIATMGAKEGLSHLALAMLSPGDVVFSQDPTYPIHPYSAIIAGADVRRVPIGLDRDFFEDLLTATRQTWPMPKLLIICYPHNPTTAVVDRDFFQKIVDFAREHNIRVIHDLAYADLSFEGYTPPSMLEIPGARDVGVEFFSMSKSYSMPGWRMGFCCGNKDMVHALTRIKSYLDYGIFQPIQIASIIALNGPQDCVQDIVNIYKDRRDALVEGLNRIGWKVEKPKATMFVWAKIPEEFRKMGSVEFSKLLLQEGKMAVSPGLGFGHYGDDHVRFALVENRHRINQALRGVKKVLG